ncbi:MAG: hypothetical protein Q7W16_08575 [Coriobacteriia bacterium]|nr:hypothetical protein [Coriobacteriia bacterium]
MSTATGLDLRRALRLTGVFAPVSVLVAVHVALVAILNSEWGTWSVAALLPAAVAVAGWVVTRGERPLVRAGSAAACVAISALSVLLVFWGIVPGIQGVAGGVVASVVWYLMLGAPWAVLVLGGTKAARAGRYEGNARVTIWWILAIGASGLAVPITAWMASAGIADDMSMLVLYFIPPVAMCMWFGLATFVGGIALARRRDVSTVRAVPASEVTAT